MLLTLPKDYLLLRYSLLVHLVLTVLVPTHPSHLASQDRIACSPELDNYALQIPTCVQDG